MKAVIMAVAGLALACLPSLPCLPLLAADDVSSPPAVAGPITGRPRADGTYEVLWDVTHGIWSDYQPSEKYSNLLSALRERGCGTSITWLGVQNINLSLYDVLVVSVGTSWDSPYTAHEVAAIQGFVDGGGGLLVLGDHKYTPHENIDPITQAFGTTSGHTDVYGAAVYFTNFTAHKVFDGIATLHYCVAGVLAVSAPSTEAAWSDDGEALLAIAGECDVIVTSDSNFCDDRYLADVDNLEFTLNVFDCLADVNTPVGSSSWGKVKALFR